MTGWSLGYELVYILVAGVFATYFWRGLGVFAAASMDADGEPLRWVRAVSTALVAALIARLVLFPQGALAALPLWLRVGAFAAGFAAFLVGRQSVLTGILAGEAMLLAGALLVTP